MSHNIPDPRKTELPGFLDGLDKAHEKRNYFSDLSELQTYCDAVPTTNSKQVLLIIRTLMRHLEQKESQELTDLCIHRERYTIF